MVGGKAKYTELVMELITKRLIKKNIVLMTTKIDAGMLISVSQLSLMVPVILSHRMIDFDLT